MTKLWPVLVVALQLVGCVIVSGDDAPPAPFCGDGVRDSGEACDDGNTLAGDGCSATCTLEQTREPKVTASWSHKNLATNTATACPTGYDTAAVYSQRVDSQGNNVGQVVVDLFDCAAGTGTTAALEPTTYVVWIEIANTNNTSVYAKSLSAHVDLTTQDQSFSAQILNDGGYFSMAWTLVGASSGNTLTCAQAGAAGVESIATDVSNSSNSASDIFDCPVGSGVTAGFLAATYTVSVAALNSADQSIGTAPALTNRVISPRNAVTQLGTIAIPITGQ